MSEYLYCQTCADLPGLIRIGSADTDPRWVPMAARPAPTRRRFAFSWVLKVRNRVAAESALRDTLAPYQLDAIPGLFRCSPMQARAAAIRFVTLGAPEEERDQIPLGGARSLGTSVLTLAVALQFIPFASGPHALIFGVAAAALWLITRSGQQPVMTPVAAGL